MTVYADTSVLLSAFTIDALTDRARRWLQTAPSLRVSSWAAAEFSAAALRKVRLGELDQDGLVQAESLMDRMIRDPRAYVIVTKEDVVEARRLVRLLPPLRAPDALHLATAQRLRLPMATFDAGLVKAAVAVGVEVVAL